MLCLLNSVFTLWTAMPGVAPAGPGVALSIYLHGVCLPGQGQQDLWGGALSTVIMQRAEVRTSKDQDSPKGVQVPIIIQTSLTTLVLQIFGVFLCKGERCPLSGWTDQRKAGSLATVDLMYYLSKRPSMRVQVPVPPQPGGISLDPAARDLCILRATL